jgi:hypothetical protein
MTDQWVEAVASTVTNKTLSRKSDGRQFVLYEVETDMGKFSTTKRDLAADAHRLVGKPGRFLVKTEQRGDFTNYYLEAVEEGTREATSSFPVQMPKPPEAQSTSAALSPPDMSGEPTQKDIFIFRQTAGKVAAQISETADEFWSNIEDIANYFITGEKPGVVQNQYVPEAALATVASGGFEDSDIPFDRTIDNGF